MYIPFRKNHSIYIYIYICMEAFLLRGNSPLFEIICFLLNTTTSHFRTPCPWASATSSSPPTSSWWASSPAWSAWGARGGGSRGRAEGDSSMEKMVMRPTRTRGPPGPPSPGSRQKRQQDCTKDLTENARMQQRFIK